MARSSPEHSDPPPENFEERWLRMAGVAPDESRSRADRARSRAGRFPLHVRLARWWTVAAIVWLGPLLILGRFARATRLEAGPFERLMQYLREHRWTPLRLAALAAVAPAMEVLEEDEPPMVPDHPLAGRLDTPSARDSEHYDILVIGSGAGGAPVAAELAESGARVGIVEKGGLVEPESTSGALEHHYVHQGLLGVARGTPIVVLAGSTVGGSTSVNSGTSLHPLQECLEAWDGELGTHFSEGELEPWLHRVDEAISVQVPPERLRSASAEVVADGLDALGREEYYGLPRCIDGCRGSGRCCFGCPTGAKQSTDRAFVPRALDAGADLYANHEATRIREHGDRVEVDVRGEGGNRTLEADRLVLSAGALFTPGLIRDNRLGSHWIHAGRHFKTHPATKVFATVPDVERPEEFPGIPQGLGYRPPELERIGMEGAELPPSAVGPILPAGGARFRRWIQRPHELVSYGAMIRDRNTGRVDDLFGEPVISYDLHDRDAADLGRAVKLIGEIFFAAGAERVLLPVPGREHEFESAAELERFEPESVSADQFMLSGFHPQGTAGMGRIVDTDLRLRGSDRIAVCDASVLPDSPGVNPQVTIMAFALRLADRLREAV